MTRKPNTFEIIVLIIGLLITFFGAYLIHYAIISENLYYLQVLELILLWTLLISMMIILALNENIKEELKQIIHLQTEELRLIKRELRDYFDYRRASIMKQLRQNKQQSTRKLTRKSARK